jgi:hypothetical protein
MGLISHSEKLGQHLVGEIRHIYHVIHMAGLYG